MQKVHPLLKIISKLSDGERKVLFPFLTHEGCDGIYECVHNGLSNPTLNEEDRRDLNQKLLPQKNKFRKLIKESDPVRKKRALLQVGEGVGLLVEKVVPLLEDYLQSK